ncbi:tachykinin-like peptides receptor 86C [Ptychodera flava]|uniref:tachykinin-like peptides receptor 86C n=1 Tax=Ptychodera flava TaxID=63121 RepID=UPI00396A5E77
MSNTATNASANIVEWPATPAYVYITELILGVVGTTGNAVVIIVVLSTPKMKTLTNYFIINLAVADFITSVLLVFNRFLLKAVTIPIPDGIAGEIYCRLYFSAPFFWFSVNASSFGLVLVTLERYFAIVHPLSYEKYCTTERASVVIATSWGCMFALQFSTLAFQDYHDGRCLVAVYLSQWLAPLIGVLYFLITYFVPVCVMIWAYFRILRSLRQSTENSSRPASDNQQRTKALLKARKRVVCMLLLVMAAFLACWTPDSLLFLVYNFGVVIDLGSVFVNCIVLLKFSNSILNPFIYVFKYKQFRQSFLRNLCSCLRCGKNKVGDQAL